MKIKSISVGLISLTILTSSCKNDTESVPKAVFSTDNLISQNFTVNTDRDTILTGKFGTKIRIYKNSFIDENSELVKGAVHLDLKEVLTPEDIILGGLSTLSQGKMLQTGGMIYLAASQNDKPVELGPNKIVGMIVPTDTILSNMQVYNGIVDSLGIDWREPKPILNGFQWAILDSDTIKFRNASELKMKLDSIKHDNFNNELEVSRHGESDAEASPEITFIQEIEQPKGTNIFVTDFNMTYVFTMQKLGWANIDRLYSDPRTTDVEFLTEIENNSEFKNVFITLVTEKMYLPGYQMKNGSYSFTHGDDEKPRLPVGATAVIVSTAYKNNIPFFAIKKITITDKQTIKLKLVATTTDKLKIDVALAI